MKPLIVLLSVLLLAGCVTKPQMQGDPYYAPVNPSALQQPSPINGSIYSRASAMNLYGNGRAHRIGDIITVVLSENTQSSKSAKTELDKETTINQQAPTVLGRNFSDLGFSVPQSTTEFDGEGKSDMSNSLTGNISVTVHNVLPNGNMIVRGEKWLTLNQGDEYIRISGIVRPQDVSVDNTVPSTKLADARIAYAGEGTVSNTNEMGWISKFFISPFWLF
ncbi:flagellar basal body L-ring protein FlgH [Marinobacterium jannaschii]|uniref:flagellar basal body L-ring protein FlgH n=1 Tax=Marinobacterium jannaschii TaxID=64970 RepID=UPI000483191C|nr:flagellar basal body L-ring protein FlgH [Marinobacterium jannaschii]